MKSVIDGKLYDTEKSRCLCSYSNGLPSSDFGFLWYDLYLTRNGMFFIDGAGGVHSRYGKECGDYRCSSSGIQVVSDDEARDMLETAGEVAVMMELFKIEDA